MTADIPQAPGSVIGHNLPSAGEMLRDAPALIYSDDALLPRLCAEIRAEIAGFPHDLNTAAGRARTASLAHSIACRKTPLTAAAKVLTEGWRKQTQAVNSQRASIEQALDALRDTARAPLNAWEAEEARIAGTLARLQALPGIAAAASSAAIDSLIAEAGAIAPENAAIGKAKGEALIAIAQAREAAVGRERDAAELQALRDAEALRLGAEAAETVAARRAQLAAEQALADERQAAARAEADRQAALGAANKRAADEAHANACKRSIYTKLCEIGVSPPQAVKCVEALAAGEIPHLSIKY